MRLSFIEGRTLIAFKALFRTALSLIYLLPFTIRQEDPEPKIIQAAPTVMNKLSLLTYCYHFMAN